VSKGGSKKGEKNGVENLKSLSSGEWGGRASSSSHKKTKSLVQTGGGVLIQCKHEQSGSDKGQSFKDERVKGIVAKGMPPPKSLGNRGWDNLQERSIQKPEENGIKRGRGGGRRAPRTLLLGITRPLTNCELSKQSGSNCQKGASDETRQNNQKQ